MKLKEYTEKNRLAWNAAMPYHQKVKKTEWDTFFRQPGYIIQQEPELTKLIEVGIAGKAVIHLCCNNGRELMSLKNMGADYCLGVDISDEAIAEAIQRAQDCNIEVDYLRSDVYDITSKFDGKFDLVYMTIGGLCWLPDLNGFFAIVSRLLKPQGIFFIYDSHPFSIMLPWEKSEDSRIEIAHPYFETEACEYEESLDYYGWVDYKAPVHYEFTHTISDIVMGLLENNINIIFFGEYEKDISCGFEWLEPLNLKIPLSYILIGNKHKEKDYDNKRIRFGRSQNSRI